MSLQTFKNAYIEAIFFTESGDADDPLTKDRTAADFAPETIERIDKDCELFYESYSNVWAGLCNYDGCTEDEYAGHDLWLTRNGHGCGFWDGDWKEPAATILDDAALKMEVLVVYVGDDGLIYFA